MSDEITPDEPRTLKVVTCINRRHPTRSCYGLVEDVPEVRQKHRQWHLDQETDREALRGAVKTRDETIALLRQEIAGYGRDVAAYGQEVAGFHGEVQRVETPLVPPALQINRDGYDDDELDDEPDSPDPIDLDLPANGSFITVPVSAPQSDDDEDDDAVDHPATQSPAWAR